VVDPARIIALIAAINQFSTLQAEKKRVMGIVRIESEALLGLRFGNAFSHVLNDASTKGNFPCREYAIAMNGRVPHTNVRICK